MFRGRRGRRQHCPYSRPPVAPPSVAPARSQMWTHATYCLHDPELTNVPANRSLKQALIEAGLGEKELSVPVTQSSAEFHDAIVQLYPALQSSGGYSLFKCMGSSRRLVGLEVNTPSTIRTSIGQSRLYIKPLQRAIPLHLKDEEVRTMFILG